MRKITDNKELTKLVSFLTMSDGGVYRRKSKSKKKDGIINASFIMNHTSKQYTEYAKEILENLTTVQVDIRKDYNTDGCDRKEQFRLYTKTHPTYSKIKDRLYMENYKSIDSHSLKRIDGECLAMLYMADGCLALKGEAISGVTLNTKRLTEGDNLLLSKYLENILGIESTVNKQSKYTYIRIKGKSVYKFFELIKPYILSDFNYKVPDDKLLAKYKQDGEIVCSSS